MEDDIEIGRASGKIDKTEILCLLTDKKKGEFIAFIDEDSGYFETRRNDNKPFRYPFEEIEEGYMFVITTEVVPGTMLSTIGTMLSTIGKAEIFRYVDVIKNEILMNNLTEEFRLWYQLDIRDELNKKVEELRNNKIETIVKNG